MNGGVPDLGRVVAQAQQAKSDAWAHLVNIPDGQGGVNSVPAPVGVFLMLDALITQVKRLADAAEQLANTQIVKP